MGSAQRMKEVAKLITDGEQKIVVLSAMSGTTNTLVEISDYLYKKNPEGANEIINKLESKYKQHVDELFATQEYKQKGLEVIKSHFDYIRSYTKDLFTLFEEKVVLAQGELISTAMVNFYLQECGVKSVLLPALEFMRTDKNAEPDPVYIKDKLRAQLDLYPDTEIYITQGFICRNAYGEIDNLQRVMLPGASGEEVLKEIRKHGRLPVIVLTAKDSIDDKIGVLTDGADDYITKPFEIREVLARIQVQLRHIEVETKGEAEAETKVEAEAETEVKTKAGIQKGQGSGRLEFRDMVLTRSTFEVSIGGRVLPKITKQEFAILELLLKNPKQVFSKEDIFEYAWDEPYMGETKTLDVHISNIRKKIKTVTSDEYIETIWGIGYRLHE